MFTLFNYTYNYGLKLMVLLISYSNSHYLYKLLVQYCRDEHKSCNDLQMSKNGFHRTRNHIEETPDG